MIDINAKEKSGPLCAWCSQLVASNASSATLCGLNCHDQTSSGGNRRDCLYEHTRECEICLSVSKRLPGLGMVTPLFWECRCEEGYIHPYHHPECLACSTNRHEGMPARVRDVLLFALEWHLEADSVALLREEFPDPWAPDLQADALLEATVIKKTTPKDWICKQTGEIGESLP